VKIKLFSLIVLIFVSAPCSAQDDFDKLNTAFIQKASQAFGPEVLATHDSLSLYVSKNLVERAIETPFNATDVRVSATVPQRGYEVPSQEIRIKEISIKCPQIDCGSCDKGCGRFDVRCKLEEAACETFVRKPCLAYKTVVDEACRAARQLGNRLSGTHIGDASFKNVSAGGSVITTPITLDLDPKLTTAALKAKEFRGDIKASGELFSRARIEVILAQLMTGTIGICHPLQLIIAKDIDVTVTTDTLNFDTVLEKTKTESEEGMRLKLRVENARTKLRTNLSPLFQVLYSNPHLFITCGVGAASLQVVGIFDTFRPISIKLDQNVPKIMTFDVGELRIDLPMSTKPLLLIPRENDLSLGVIGKR
jgi:hypothetical protein